MAEGGSMKHFGDITKIKGSEVPIVDIVCGGSPCQDLSVAGNRKGLSGERSGLFMEQIRIIKELRNESTKQLRLRGADDDFRHIKPRFMVWENVAGAFSSNNGEDFRTVLEETAKICDQNAVIPRPPKGKWTPSGCIMGNGWSIAWRLHDAQFWGVPQRRKRIALVADFGGESAPEILFERKGVSGDIEQSRKEGEATPRNATECPDKTSYTLKVRGGREFDSKGKRAGKGALIQTELSGTLSVTQDQTLITSEPICIGGGQLHDAMTPSVNVSKTLNCLVDPMKVVCVGNGQLMQTRLQEKCGTLNCMHDQQAILIYEDKK